MLLFLNDGFYRQGLRLYAHSWLSGRANEAMTEARSYMDLRTKNEYLLQEKARLEYELVALQRQISDAQAEQTLPQLRAIDNLGNGEHFVTARIVNLLNTKGEHHYVINRGRKSGIRKDMAVVSERGVLGAILETSDHYSIVIPIINPKLRLSCSVRGKEYRGQLVSHGLGRPAFFIGVPLHSAIAVGDTLETSGYSYIFPEGLVVGTVEASDRRGATGANAAFGSYRVKLRTDFERLSYVYVLLTPPVEEARQLEQTLTPEG